MKKYLVLVIVVLLGAVLYVRHLERKAVPQRAATSPSLQEEGGVPLPPDAKVLSLPEFTQETPRPTSRLSGTAQQPAPEIVPLSIAGTPCLRDTKVRDVIAAHGKTWGILQKDKVGSQAEKALSYAIIQAVGEEGVKNLVAKIGAHQACLSLAAGKDLCGSLPRGGESKAESAVDISMRESCLNNLYNIGFVGYTMGKSEYSNCSGYFRAGMPEAERYVKVSEFCDIAKGGLPAVTSKFCGRFPPEMKQACLETFPGEISGCRGDENCAQMWRIYKALRDNSVETLSYQIQPLVRAMLDKKEESCRPLGDSIVQEYCQMKQAIDRQLMQSDMGSKQAELNKEIKSARESQPAD